MIQLLFIAMCMASYSDIYSDTYANIYNDFSVDYTLITENENIKGIDLVIGYETKAYLESNDFVEYMILDDTTLGYDEIHFNIIDENIINYKLIRYTIIPESSYMTWNNDFVTVGLSFGIYIELYSSSSEYETIYTNNSVTKEYDHEYSGGAYGGQNITLDNSSYLDINGNIYLDNTSPEYLSGYNAGYDAGVQESSKEHPVFKIFNAVFSVIDNVLQVEILPSIRLWYLLGIPLFFLILQFVLNLFR